MSGKNVLCARAIVEQLASKHVTETTGRNAEKERQERRAPKLGRSLCTDRTMRSLMRSPHCSPLVDPKPRQSTLCDQRGDLLHQAREIMSHDEVRYVSRCNV